MNKIEEFKHTVIKVRSKEESIKVQLVLFSYDVTWRDTYCTVNTDKSIGKIKICHDGLRFFLVWTDDLSQINGEDFIKGL